MLLVVGVDATISPDDFCVMVRFVELQLFRVVECCGVYSMSLLPLKNVIFAVLFSNFIVGTALELFWAGFRRSAYSASSETPSWLGSESRLDSSGRLWLLSQDLVGVSLAGIIAEG